MLAIGLLLIAVANAKANLFSSEHVYIATDLLLWARRHYDVLTAQWPLESYYRCGGVYKYCVTVIKLRPPDSIITKTQNTTAQNYRNFWELVFHSLFLSLVSPNHPLHSWAGFLAFVEPAEACR